MPFNLRAAVIEVMETSSLTENREIAEKVIENLARADIRPALAEALPAYIGRIQSELRSALNIQRVDAQYDRDGNPRPIQQVFIPSSKQAAIRDHWRAVARQHIIATPDGRKSILDCTRDDLLYAASQREQLAKANAIKAKGYKAAAATLAEHGVEVVSDLPDDVLRLMLGQVAA